jgi:hypothetical protein
MGAQTAMPARTGKESLHGLKDEHQIWVGGERVRRLVDRFVKEDL